MPSEIKIAYAPDNNCVNATFVSMVSVLENNKDLRVEFIVLSSKLSKESKRKINSLLECRNCKLRFVEISETDFNELLMSDAIGIRALFVLKIPELCEDVNRVLYLDCDTIVMQPLQELWDKDLDGCYVAAVKELRDVEQSLKRLRMKSLTYFNSAVMLINCKKFRNDRMLEKIKRYYKKNEKRIRFGVQDILNGVIERKKIVLEQKYNYMEAWWDNGYYEYWGNEEKLYLEARKNPVIIYMIGLKPNNKGCKHSFRSLWWKYAEKTSIYEEILSSYEDSLEPKEEKENKFFSVKNEYEKNKKWKVFSIFGIKLKIRVRKNNNQF